MKTEVFRKIGRFFQRNWKIIVTWILILVIIEVGIYLDIDKKIIAAVVFFFGIVSQAFSGLAALIALIPIAGPIIVKVLSLPVFWLLNATGYFVSVLAIKKGYGKDVINYRMVTVIFLIGFTIGFIVARLMR